MVLTLWLPLRILNVCTLVAGNISPAISATSFWQYTGAKEPSKMYFRGHMTLLINKSLLSRRLNFGDLTPTVKASVHQNARPEVDDGEC